MQLQLIRIYTKIGMVGQLWNNSFLVLYWIERNTCKDVHSWFFRLPAGDYLLRPATTRPHGLILASQPGAGKIKTVVWAQPTEVTLIRDCEEPLCMITSDGETQLTHIAMQNLEDIFNRGYQKLTGISLSIKDSSDHELNKTGL